jgi:hypothetical protein
LVWTIRILPEADEELGRIPKRERAALLEAFLKLEAQGDQLGAPHSSSVRGIAGYLRELRPRRGSSPWRALYRRIGNEMVVGAIAPEVETDRRGFNRAVLQAMARLDAYVDRGE